MKRLLLCTLFAGLALNAVAVEPATTPEVRTTDAPEVTDPDLKEALPAMRQGTEEPVGGFKDAGLKGHSSWVFGWDQIQDFGMPKLGFRYWFQDALAWHVAVGGYYREADMRSVSSMLNEEASLRLKVSSLGQTGHFFVDLIGGARQGSSHEETQVDQGTYVQFESHQLTTTSYGVGLRGGAELFWPTSRRLSLELSGGLGGSWTTTDDNLRRTSSDGVSGLNSMSKAQNRNYELGSRYGNLLAAVNLYY